MAWIALVHADNEMETKKEKYDLVICAVFHNESFFLKEWLEFHKLMGVQHFYLYNNLSTDNYKEILQPYMESGEVEVFEWPIIVRNQQEYLNLLQIPAYNHALALAKQKSEWAAFIDLDEFLFPVKHDNLIDLLIEYTHFAGLSVNWQIYGTSWIDTLPENGMIIENLVLKAPQNLHMNQFVKLIVQPCFVKMINNPHGFAFHEGFFAADSNGRPLSSNVEGQPVVVDTIRINHYWCGTRDWFIHQKIPRRERWGFTFPPSALDDILLLYNQVKDDAILRFAPQLKKSLFANRLQEAF